MRGLFKTLVSAIILASGATAQKSPKWLLVRSNAEKLGSYSWDRLAQAYLQKDYLIVKADKAKTHPKASRFVVGTPTDNPLVKTLAARFKISYSGKRFRFMGQRFPDDAGLAIVTDDPDGEGRLILFTGATPTGVFSCLSVRVDLEKQGFVAMKWQRALLRGKLASSKPFVIDKTALRIVRLDQELWRIQDRMAASSIDEAALRVSRAFAGYRFLYERAVKPEINLFEFTRRQFGREKEVLLATRKRFAKVDIDSLVREEEAMVSKALGGRMGPMPIVYTIVTQAHATNAQTIGKDARTGRIRMTINLAAFSSTASLRLAVAHEFVHTLQRAHAGTLLERALHEGVASYVSQQLHPGTKDHEALMWSPEKLAAATKQRKAILEVFRDRMDFNDMRRIGFFLYGGQRLRLVLGAPDRCGYWIGFMAVGAWRAKHPNRPLSDLLIVPSAKLFAALDR